jgi:hypothetical protein
MPLSPYALVTLPDLKAKLIVAGDGMDAQLERCINQASAVVESHLDRQLISRGELEEFHTPPPRTCELFPGEWPIVSVTEIREDITIPRTYPASSVLAVDVDYELVRSPVSLIRRLNYGSLWYWWPGRRTVKMKYVAGYTLVSANPQVTPLLPEHIKGVVLDLAALYYSVDERKKHGISGASDAAGNWTRFSPAELTDDMKTRLSSERREPFPGTWERAA